MNFQDYQEMDYLISKSTEDGLRASLFSGVVPGLYDTICKNKPSPNSATFNFKELPFTTIFVLVFHLPMCCFYKLIVNVSVYLLETNTVYYSYFCKQGFYFIGEL